jgi:RNA polymerase sigma-70 factor (ECF subfamily)
VIAVAAHIVGDTATAEDIASEAFERLARQTTEVRDTDAWLRTVAYRSALNELRRRERQVRAHRRAAAEAPVPRTPDELVDDGDRRAATAVARLPAQQKAAALLCWGDGLSVGEAAEVMGCAASTVRVHLFRARRTLQPMLRDGVAASTFTDDERTTP